MKLSVWTTFYEQRRLANSNYANFPMAINVHLDRRFVLWDIRFHSLRYKVLVKVHAKRLQLQGQCQLLCHQPNASSGMG